LFLRFLRARISRVVAGDDFKKQRGRWHTPGRSPAPSPTVGSNNTMIVALANGAGPQDNPGVECRLADSI
jgi:hypothetical protein